ncbi:branched-chain amino acid ABC transporter permease [Allopusillimonas soli]|uniref:Branched-chain amino acid ABC transporter permease n=1 Tax=Allopusillimonas soli TaxID=659016 RepID=A0A853F7C6_9BURK|nr:branched-chain amino acid ABC transporter permease [Allopusillimonas soli]NYT36003.1 branched-chain amino acid ABC transporter permease [Allopusillimonas soli]TEA76347.1 branched-chain amino acid ABC transporter permease [Allopusillimonas soli]
MIARTLSITAAIIAAYVAVPLIVGDSHYIMSLITASLVVGGVALAWALLGNLGGMVSFGHSAFFGVGAYVSAILTMKAGVPVLAAMLLGGLGATIASIVMLPVLRLRGPYFALAILAYAHIFKIVATEWSSMTGGSGGISSIPRFPHVLGLDLAGKTGNYLIILTILLVFVLCYGAIRRSHYGIALRAMHETEDATRVLGVNSTLLKAMMLFVSAFMTGVVGAFNAHYINFLEPDYAFNGVWITLPIIAAIFGGYRTVVGPLLGALVVYLVDQLVFKSLIPSGHQLILGALLVAMIIFSPRGLLPLLANRRNHASA